MEEIVIIQGIVFILMFYVAEVGAYFWHRIGAHTEIIDNLGIKVKKTHDIHHTVIDDEAHADFIYVCFLLLFYLTFLLVIYYYNYIDFTWLLILYLPVLLTLVWNWYVHSAYHIEDHWLNQYNWFQHDKRIHMLHHTNPYTNYGIATHFSDEIFSTICYS